MSHVQTNIMETTQRPTNRLTDQCHIYIVKYHGTVERIGDLSELICTVTGKENQVPKRA